MPDHRAGVPPVMVRKRTLRRIFQAHVQRGSVMWAALPAFRVRRRLDISRRDAYATQRTFQITALQVELQKMRGAGDARVIVAHHLFALPGELFVRQIQALAHKLTQVGLDGPLVLGGGRHDLGLEDHAVLVQPVAVVEQPPGGFGGGAAHRRPGRNRHRRPLRPLVGLDDGQGLLHRIRAIPRPGR